MALQKYVQKNAYPYIIPPSKTNPIFSETAALTHLEALMNLTNGNMSLIESGVIPYTESACIALDYIVGCLDFGNVTHGMFNVTLDIEGQVFDVDSAKYGYVHLNKEKAVDGTLVVVNKYTTSVGPAGFVVVVYVYF